MSISNGLGLYNLCRKMEKTQPMREEMDEDSVFFLTELAFSRIVFMIEIISPDGALIWPA